MLETLQFHSDRRIDEHTENSKDKTDDHRSERSLRIQPFPKHSEEKNDENWRRQIALHGLQIIIQTVRALNHRNPKQSDEHHGCSSDAAGAHQLVLRRAGFVLAIEVDRKKRGAGVKHARQ